jgi:putative peptidoglycan lipid II flippase
MLLGSIFELYFLIFILKKHSLLKITKPNFKHSSITSLVKQFPIKTASSLISGTTGFVSQFFAAQLAVGSISTINYGSKIPSIISMIITTSISSIFLTYFSKLILIDKKKAFRNLKKTLIILFILTSLCSILIYNFSQHIIEFLFESGNFTKEDTLRVSSIQKILIFNVPFYCSSILIISFLTSINQNKFMLYASIINLLSNILLSRYFVHFMNIEGLALANLIMYAINFLVLFSFLNLHCNKNFKECSS